MFQTHKKKTQDRKPASQTVDRLFRDKKASQSFSPRRAKNQSNPFFPGTRASEKTLLSLQTCERLPQASALQHAASPLSAKPLGFVDSLKRRIVNLRLCHFLAVFVFSDFFRFGLRALTSAVVCPCSMPSVLSGSIRTFKVEKRIRMSYRRLGLEI